MPSPIPRQSWHRPGEPRASLYTPDWTKGMGEVETMEEPMRGHYRAFFAHLDAGWGVVRPLQLVAESMMRPRKREHDVAAFVDVHVTDAYRWVALGALLFIPGFKILPEMGDRAPYKNEPPVSDVIPESEGVARSARLLARMECAPDFPDGFRGAVASAAEALTSWAAEMKRLARPIIDYVDADLE